jgi:predicted transcriptional regulator
MKMSNIEEDMILSPRDQVYSIIIKNPGLHFREIQRRVDIATGALQYHVDYLKKKGLIKEEKSGKFVRFYSVREESVDKNLMNLLRQDQVRKILLFLINKRRANTKLIAENLGMSKSTAQFHMNKLVEENIVLEKKEKNNTFYSIKNKEPIIEHLIIYKKSFLDELVESFADLWEKELGLE